MTGYDVVPAGFSDGLLIGRLVLGLSMAAHGSQKLFGWFGGHGIAGTGGFFEQLGFRPGRIFAGAAGFSEFTGGLLLALGLLGPIGPALILSVMVVATIVVHWKNGFFAMSGGIETTLLYATTAVVFALTGYGRFSLDAALGLEHLWSPGIAVVALAVGALGGLLNVLTRRPAPVTPAAQSPA